MTGCKSDWVPVRTGYKSDWVPVRTGYQSDWVPVRLGTQLTGTQLTGTGASLLTTNRIRMKISGNTNCTTLYDISKNQLILRYHSIVDV